MRIACVIVTFNRLEDLKSAVQAVDQQVRRPDIIIIVDNCSRDGTGAWLEEASARRDDLMVLSMEANYGGAGGFHYGIEAAWRRGADWIWTMDDDCRPAPDALAQLIRGIEAHGTGNGGPLGFLASRVDWKDGRPHRMNAPGLAGRGLANPRRPTARVSYASFVSILIHRRAVSRVGLPVKELFLYGDDVEFTRRITSAGFAADYVESSRVRHLTPENRGVTLSRLAAWPPLMRQRQIALRNLVAVNRHRAWAPLREPGRLAWVWFQLVRNGTPVRVQYQLLAAGVGGLFFNFRQWIRFPGSTAGDDQS